MMLKLFFWLLLLGNAGLLAYQQGYFDAMIASGREPGRVKEQINADKLKLVPPPDAGRPAEAPVEPSKSSAPVAPSTPTAALAALPPPEAGRVSAPVSTLAAAPAAAPAPTPVVAAPPPVAPTVPGQDKPASPVEATAAPGDKKQASLACVEIGNFNAEDAKRFNAQLAGLSLGDKVSQRAIMEVANHMVYIPPQPDKEAAEKKASELRRLGIDDFFIIQDNSAMRWGISLGVFKQEEAARSHLAALTQKGVRSARIGQRTVTSKEVAFQLRDLDAGAKGALEKIKASFPKQDMRKCEAA